MDGYLLLLENISLNPQIYFIILVLVLAILIFCLKKIRIKEESVTIYYNPPGKIERKIYTVSLGEYLLFEADAYRCDFLDFIEDMGSLVVYYIEEYLIYHLKKYPVSRSIFKRYRYRYFDPEEFVEIIVKFPQKRIIKTINKKNKVH